MANPLPLQKLRDYLGTLSSEEREAFAERCGTSVNYLQKAISAKSLLGPNYAIAIERESGGVLRVEDLRPDVDWQYLRDTA